MRPIGIDLFAGVGGLSLGFELAGFDVKAAVEIDPIHCAAHEYNFPDCAVISSSVVGLSGAEIRERAGIGQRPVDVVFGGAPCQGFSLIGQRALEDPRNQLVREFVRIVRELRATYFVFENVKGLTVGPHKTFLAELISEFERDGEYEVAQPWKVLDAADYGTPQHRERLILLGARKGAALPSYPRPTACAADRKPNGLPQGPTCAEAIGDLPNAECFAELNVTDEAQVDCWGQPSPYAAAMRASTRDDWGFGYIRNWDPDVLTASARTDHSAISRRRFAETSPGSVEPISRFFKLKPDGLSNTLRAGTDSARGAFTSPRPIHYLHPRCVTVREMARLHGFPDWFRFHDTKWHGARQIGNAVPPPLAKAVATEIMTSLGIVPERPQLKMDLGDANLLRLGMADAAAHFGVPVRIGKRDKKSGATKRRQIDIEAARQLTGT